jgi:hypothetical protein
VVTTFPDGVIPSKAVLQAERRISRGVLRCYARDPPAAGEGAALRDDARDRRGLPLCDTWESTVYNPHMSLVEQIQKDIVAAMKAKDEARLSALRMVKTALTLRQVEKMAPLDDKESQAVLATLIKQRKESVEQFTKGGRQEMADKEAAEITLIETYLPKAASEADVAAGVKAVITEMGAPTMKEMGTVMKNAMARFSAAGMRVDGKMVSEMVKKELTPK